MSVPPRGGAATKVHDVAAIVIGIAVTDNRLPCPAYRASGPSGNSRGAVHRLFRQIINFEYTHVCHRLLWGSTSILAKALLASFHLVCCRRSSFTKLGVRHSSESGPRVKASGRSRWVFASMTTLPTPFAAYSKGPGLTELLRSYACGLQPRPSVQLSSSRVSLTDDEYSHGSRNPA